MDLSPVVSLFDSTLDKLKVLWVMANYRSSIPMPPCLEGRMRKAMDTRPICKASAGYMGDRCPHSNVADGSILQGANTVLGHV